MRNIDMELLDEMTGEKIHRSIDISNFSIHHDGKNFPGLNKQREILQNWCDERGNEQHDTILTVQNWHLS